ncbi:MAG: hypothetical protein ACQESM_06455 [Bacteroidota bacterium]
MIKKFTILLLLVLFSVTVFAQFGNGKRSYYRNNPLKKKPGIGLGVGATQFFGDLGSRANGEIRPAANIKVDYRLSRSFGIELNLGGGILAETYDGQVASNDFESYFGQGHVNVRYHFDNILKLNTTTIASPFLTAGVGFMLFDTYYNIKDENGDPYQFNDDGTITNIDGEEVTRDNNFETALSENSDFAMNTPIFPLGMGVKFHFTQHIELIAEGMAYYTTHDKIDGYLAFHQNADGDWVKNEMNNANDSYFYGSITFIYNLGFNPKRRAKRYVPPIRRR